MRRKFLSFSVFILSLAIFLYFNRYEKLIYERLRGFRPPTMKNIPVTLDYEPNMKVFSHRSNILIAGKTFVGLFNKNGNEIFKNGISFTDPIVLKNKDYLLMADKNSTQFLTLALPAGEPLCVNKTDDNIIGASLGEGNLFCIITEKKGFTSRTIVYNMNGKVVYGWNAVENYITDVVPSKDNSYIVMSAFEALGNSIKTGILKLKFNDSSSKLEVKGEDTVITNLMFKNDKLISVADTFVDVGDNRIEFDEEEVLVDFHVGEKISLLFQSKDLALDNYYISTYSLNGRLQDKFYISFIPEIMKSKNNLIAIVNRNEVTIYNQKGYKIAEFFLPNQISDISFGRFGLYVLSNAELYLLSY